MYITEVNSSNKGKKYKSTLIRESYRKDGSVKNRTVANISNLPPELIRNIKLFLNGRQGDFNLADLKNGLNYEYGASYALKELARQIGLESAIFATKTEWRENVMAMIIGRILYQGSKLSLVNTFNDSALWELAGHHYGERPDVEKHCYKPMDELLKRKNKIECKFAKKHFQNGCIVLYDMTNTWLEGEYEDSETVAYGLGKGGKRGYKQIALGLLTNSEGCPVAVEIFKGNTSDQTTVLDQVKKISEKYGIKEAVFTGDRGMLTQKRIDEIKETDFKIITALTHAELKNLIKKENIQIDLFDQMNITEVIDSEDKITRYMLCKNDNEMAKEHLTRKKLITKVKELLTEKAAVKRKRQANKVSASMGRIFAKYRIEKFFTWDVGGNGELSWGLKYDVIEKEEELDGCYVIKTDASKKQMSNHETVDSYRNLQKVEQAFKNMKTVMLELRPIHHKTDDRIEAHIFIVMLAYYLQWHAVQKLKPLFDADGKGKDQRWTFEGIVDRLKSIRKIENLINGIVVKTNISMPDREQKKILELLGVTLV
jgi:transposase